MLCLLAKGGVGWGDGSGDLWCGFDGVDVCVGQGQLPDEPGVITADRKKDRIRDLSAAGLRSNENWEGRARMSD